MAERYSELDEEDRNLSRDNLFSNILSSTLEKEGNECIPSGDDLISSSDLTPFTPLQDTSFINDESSSVDPISISVASCPNSGDQYMLPELTTDLFEIEEAFSNQVTGLHDEIETAYYCNPSLDSSAMDTDFIRSPVSAAFSQESIVPETLENESTSDRSVSFQSCHNEISNPVTLIPREVSNSVLYNSSYQNTTYSQQSGLSVPNFEDWNSNSSDSSMPTSSFATPRINRPPDPSLAPQYPRYPTSPFPRLHLPGAFPSQSQQQSIQSLDPSRNYDSLPLMPIFLPPPFFLPFSSSQQDEKNGAYPQFPPGFPMPAGFPSMLPRFPVHMGQSFFPPGFLLGGGQFHIPSVFSSPNNLPPRPSTFSNQEDGYGKAPYDSPLGYPEECPPEPIFPENRVQEPAFSGQWHESTSTAQEAVQPLPSRAGVVLKKPTADIVHQALSLDVLSEPSSVIRSSILSSKTSRKTDEKLCSGVFSDTDEDLDASKENEMPSTPRTDQLGQCPSFEVLYREDISDSDTDTRIVNTPFRHSKNSEPITGTVSERRKVWDIHVPLLPSRSSRFFGDPVSPVVDCKDCCENLGTKSSTSQNSVPTVCATCGKIIATLNLLTECEPGIEVVVSNSQNFITPNDSTEEKEVVSVVRDFPLLDVKPKRGRGRPRKPKPELTTDFTNKFLLKSSGIDGICQISRKNTEDPHDRKILISKENFCWNCKSMISYGFWHEHKIEKGKLLCHDCFQTMMERNIRKKLQNIEEKKQDESGDPYDTLSCSILSRTSLYNVETEEEEEVEEIEDGDNQDKVSDEDEIKGGSNPLFHKQVKIRNDGWDMLYSKDQQENVDLDFEDESDTETSAKDDPSDNVTFRNEKCLSLNTVPGFKSLKKLPVRSNRRDLKRFPLSRSGKASRKKLSRGQDFLRGKNIPSNHYNHDSKSKPFKTLNNLFSPVKEHFCTTDRSITDPSKNILSTNIEASSGNEHTIKELLASNKELSCSWKESSVLNSNTSGTSFSTSDEPSSLNRDFSGTSEVLRTRNVISNASTDSFSKKPTIETSKENSYENIELSSSNKGLSFTKEDLTVNFEDPMASAKEIMGSDEKFFGSMKKDDKLDNIMENFRSSREKNLENMDDYSESSKTSDKSVDVVESFDKVEKQASTTDEVESDFSDSEDDLQFLANFSSTKKNNNKLLSEENQEQPIKYAFPKNVTIYEKDDDKRLVSASENYDQTFSKFSFSKSDLKNSILIHPKRKKKTSVCHQKLNDSNLKLSCQSNEAFSGKEAKLKLLHQPSAEKTLEPSLASKTSTTNRQTKETSVISNGSLSLTPNLQESKDAVSHVVAEGTIIDQNSNKNDENQVLNIMCSNVNTRVPKTVLDDGINKSKIVDTNTDQGLQATSRRLPLERRSKRGSVAVHTIKPALKITRSRKHTVSPLVSETHKKPRQCSKTKANVDEDEEGAANRAPHVIRLLPKTEQ